MGGGGHNLAEGRIQRKRRTKTEDECLTSAVTNRRPKEQGRGAPEGRGSRTLVGWTNGWATLAGPERGDSGWGNGGGGGGSGGVCVLT